MKKKKITKKITVTTEEGEKETIKAEFEYSDKKAEPVIEKMDVIQVVGYMATKDNVLEEFNILLKADRLISPEATKNELKRLGHYMG